MSIAVGNTRRLDYDGAVRRAMGLADFERGTHSPGHSTFHLERIACLLDRLGNPHLDTRTLHVAGTKGKGSTAAMAASMLSAGGMKVGLYTSPSLHSVTERIRVGMDPIAREDFADLVNRTWGEVEWTGERGGYGPLTFFEFMTALAFVHFKEVGADFQVIETGLGGRLDATNVVRPDVCVITSISLDHVSVLGDTLSSIAAEKGGIIKRGVPVVVAPQGTEAMGVIRRIALERGSPVVDVLQEMSWEHRMADLDGQSFVVEGLGDVYEVDLPLAGSYQQENAAAAIAAVETLKDGGVALSKSSIIEGLRGVRWPGRFQTLAREGALVVVDGAHNPYSMRRFVEALREHVRFEHALVVFGAVGGHSAEGMLEELAVLDPTVIAVQSRHPKAASVEEIAAAARSAGLSAAMEPGGVGEAARRALGRANDGDVVLGTGSLSVVGEMIEAFEGVAPETYPYLKGVQRNER